MGGRSAAGHPRALRDDAASLERPTRHGRPPERPLIMQNNGPTGICSRARGHGSSCSKPQSSMPTSRRRPPLPRRTSTEPRRRSRSSSVRSSASWTRSPEPQSTAIKPRARNPCTVPTRCVVTARGRSAERVGARGSGPPLTRPSPSCRRRTSRPSSAGPSWRPRGPSRSSRSGTCRACSTGTSSR